MTEAFALEQVSYYLPALILSTTALALMLITAYKRNHTLAGIFTNMGLLAALVLQTQQLHAVNYQTVLFVFDGIAALISCSIIFAGLMISLLLHQWLQQFAEDSEEYYLLLLLSVVGALIVTASNHFASFFIGLELMGLSLVAMIAYQGNNNQALEAGIKYLVLSSTASAFMLMAMAVLYLYTGTLSIPEVMGKMSGASASSIGNSDQLIQNAAIVLLLIGITFKLSLVPAHLWAADVFAGSPLPTNALLASISKASVFVVLLRLFSVDAFNDQHAIVAMIAVIAAASMLIGNLLGLMQRNMMRLMAYSSIAHFGYILLAILTLDHNPTLVAGNAGSLLGSSSLFAQEAAIYYMIAYTITITGIFSMLMLLPDCSNIDNLSGLLWKKPAISLVLIVLLLSLAGIPLTIGFVGKFYLVLAAVNHQLWWLLATLVIGSVISLFYYLRIVWIMADKPAETPSGSTAISGMKYHHLVAMLVFVSLVIGIGVLPNGLAELIHNVITR